MPDLQFKVLRSDDESAPNPQGPVRLNPSRRFSIADSTTGAAGPRRSAWRQRLIDAEGGLRLSLRMDGTMFAHLFVACCVLAAGFVLGLSARQWAIIALAITLVITTETFHQMLRALWAGVGHHLPPAVRDVVRIGAAAVLLASIGAGTAIVLVFADRLSGS
jgi:diacylglycerol kinase (ATP)